MKRIFLAVAVMFSLGSVVAQQKIAHVYTDSLLSKMPSRQAAIEQLQKFEQDGYKELQEMEADFNKQVGIYEAGKNAMSPVIMKMEEEKLRKKSASMDERQQSLQSDLQLVSQELNKPILEKVTKSIELVADRKKLAYVIDATNTLYTKGGMNITSEVLVELLKLDTAVSAPVTVPMK